MSLLTSTTTWAGEAWRRLRRDVAIFWDYDNSLFPTAAEQEVVVKRILETANGFGTVNFLRAYTFPLQPGQVTPEKILKSHKGSLKVCPGIGEREVVNKAILLEMLLRAFDTHDRATKTTIVLITGDGDFVEAVEQLKARHFEVVVIAHVQFHNRLAAASVLLDYETVLGVPAKEPVKEVSKPPPPVTASDSSTNSSPQVTIFDPPPSRLSPQVTVSDSTPKSSPQVTIFDSPPEVPPESQEENNDDTESDFELLYEAGDLKMFEPLISCLLRYKNQGYSTTNRAVVGESFAKLVKTDPEVYQRAGCRGFRGYIRRAEDLYIIERGRSGGTDWIKLDPELVDQINLVARIGAASKEP